MPYEWLPPQGDARRLHLWPHRSLPKPGLIWFMGGTILLVSLPVVMLFGSPVLWGILPFIVLAIAGAGYALGRSYRDREIIEELMLTPTEITLTRHGPKRIIQNWHANPHWVQVSLYPTSGKVPNYLTLKGNQREVELGAFLSEDERIALRQEVQDAIAQLRP